MVTKDDKKAMKKLNAVCQKMAESDYIGLYAFTKYGTKNILIGNNIDNSEIMAKLIACIIIHRAKDFDKTPDEFLKMVEEKFKLEAE